MNFIPTFKQIKAKDQLNAFSEMYLDCSGLPIPEAYLTHSDNRVFGIFWKGALIGGFILGRDPNFRTIKFFAQEEEHETLYTQLGDRSAYTEICCFWIGKKFRTKTFLNFFVWFAMTYALRMYGTRYFLFGTCSRSLARLYGQTSKSMLIHKDRVNRKSTFIFYAERKYCFNGMMEIIKHKFLRLLKTMDRPAILSWS